MVPYFVLGVAVLASLLLLARWLTRADPRLLAWLVRVLALVAALAVGGFIIVTGRFQLVLYALPFALPFYFQWRSNRIRNRNAQGPAAGARSRVDTGWLEMELDHDSGEMQGTVQRGTFAGRGLDSMSLDELLHLLDELGADPDSVRVLESYLDRMHGPSWRGDDGEAEAQFGAHRRPRQDGAMTEDEALEVLGLEPGATAKEVKEAHRRLMGKLHPDRGGSTYLAAKLNQAKDFLLKQR
jgi:hypothetical protein